MKNHEKRCRRCNPDYFGGNSGKTRKLVKEFAESTGKSPNDYPNLFIFHADLLKFESRHPQTSKKRKDEIAEDLSLLRQLKYT